MTSGAVAQLRAGLARRETVFDRLQLADQDIADISFDGFSEDPPRMLMMRQSEFSGATLRNWSVSVGNLLGSNFQETKFERCNFMSTQFQGSDFFGATFRDCHFGACYMFEAFYARARFIDCTFTQVSMKDSVMSSVTFTNTGIGWLKLDGVEDATRRATAVLGREAAGSAEDLGVLRNVIDQASLDQTLAMLAARRQALPGIEQDTHPLGGSLLAEYTKHASSPAEIAAFLRTTTLTSDQIRAFLGRYRSAAS